MKDYIKMAMNCFENSFINRQNELILIPKFNIYFRLDNVENERDFTMKMLSWVSRPASKGQYYSTKWRIEKFNKETLDKLNNYLETNFTQEEMLQIYCKLGNDINRDLCYKFIDSNYDMKVLEDLK